VAAAAPTARAPDREGVRAEIGDIGAIEGLRGVAVAWVVLFHYFIVRAGRADDPWNAFVASHHALEIVVRNGYLGVDLFFLITGFLLVLPWERHRRLGLAPPDTRSFYARRIRRIVPAYYVQLALLFAVFVPLLWSPGAWRADPRYFAANLAAHATFLHYTTPVTSASLGINGALWTLALEAQYYLLLPLVAPAFVRAPWRCALAFVALAALWRLAASHDLAPLVASEMRLGSAWSVPEAAVRELLGTQLPGYLAHFALGILLALAWISARSREPARGARIASGALAFASIVLLAALYGARVPLPAAWVWLATIALFASALHFPLVAAPAVGERVLGNAALRMLGRISYSVYLYHLPVIYLWTKWRVLDGHATSLPACVAAILAISALSYRFVERPFLRKRAPAAPLVTAAA
jgi:peptidoglycan/LPS O-acetylase OafA/YrhL